MLGRVGPMMAISLVACTAGNAPEQDAQTTTAILPAPPTSGPFDATAPSAASLDGASVCLPVVTGCGCTTACGSSIKRNDDGSYQIVTAMFDSISITADAQRWCFDPEGRGTMQGSTATGASRDARCREVFYDRSACGGECIPTKQHLGCHDDKGACVE